MPPNSTVKIASEGDCISVPKGGFSKKGVSCHYKTGHMRYDYAHEGDCKFFM